MGAVIEIEGLSKTYRRRRGRVRALDGLDLSVRAGGVFGFLGPNGSGKTTTIRCLLGLARPSAGQCLVFGAESPGELPAVVGRVGALVESPGVNPGVSGRDTLVVLATTAGIGRRRVDATLELVGLSERADDPVRGYSLGMRQRLGIATALLGDPAVLILDEPANGMDPEGIRWMRGLLQDFASRGGTVVLSSHLLGEVQATVDQLVVIGRGRIVASGPLDELLAGSGTLVRGLDPNGLDEALTAAGLPLEPLLDGGFRVDAGAEQVGRAAAAAGQVLLELRESDGAGLEELFFKLTAAEEQAA
jgi:ABC-2 type transport system ATP-binding protein